MAIRREFLTAAAALIGASGAYTAARGLGALPLNARYDYARTTVERLHPGARDC